MKYDSEQMTFVGAAATEEESAALRLHYEIMAAAQAAAASLLDLARKIKLMRDTGGYKALGFDTLEAYTLTTMGMKQRQAYNYIAIAEKLPAQLIEQNAAAGVTKLALLAQLSGQEQQQIAAETNLTETTVAELKAQIKELQAKNAGYAEQLSLLQNQPPVAEVQAEETAARLNMAADESAVRFGLLFDQLQDAAGKVLDLADAVQQAGETEKAGKFRVALHKALLALADEANEVQK